MERTSPFMVGKKAPTLMTTVALQQAVLSNLGLSVMTAIISVSAVTHTIVLAKRLASVVYLLVAC